MPQLRCAGYEASLPSAQACRQRQRRQHLGQHRCPRARAARTWNLDTAGLRRWAMSAKPQPPAPAAWPAALRPRRARLLPTILRGSGLRLLPPDRGEAHARSSPGVQLLARRSADCLADVHQPVNVTSKPTREAPQGLALPATQQAAVAPAHPKTNLQYRSHMSTKPCSAKIPMHTDACQGNVLCGAGLTCWPAVGCRSPALSCCRSASRQTRHDSNNCAAVLPCAKQQLR